MGELLLIRHGETAWSRSGRHTGRTDIPLTTEGEAQAARLARVLAGRRIAATLVSPLGRAVRTAELAGLPRQDLEPDLQEWDYGGYEGVTTAQIQLTRPGWDLWRDGVPPDRRGHEGENAEQVGARVDRVLRRIDQLPVQVGADVAVVAHAHVLRVLAARRLGLPPTAGALLRLDTAALSRIGAEHGRPVITAWNQSE